MIAFVPNNGKVSFGTKVTKKPLRLRKSRMVRSMAYADGISRVCTIDANPKPSVANVEACPVRKDVWDYYYLYKHPMLQSCVQEVEVWGEIARYNKEEGGRYVIPKELEHDNDATRQHRQVELGGNGLLP